MRRKPKPIRNSVLRKRKQIERDNTIRTRAPTCARHQTSKSYIRRAKRGREERRREGERERRALKRFDNYSTLPCARIFSSFRLVGGARIRCFAFHVSTKDHRCLKYYSIILHSVKNWNELRSFGRQIAGSSGWKWFTKNSNARFDRLLHFSRSKQRLRHVVFCAKCELAHTRWRWDGGTSSEWKRRITMYNLICCRWLWKRSSNCAPYLLSLTSSASTVRPLLPLLMHIKTQTEFHLVRGPWIRNIYL